jgi:hypothetical protein
MPPAGAANPLATLGADSRFGRYVLHGVHGLLGVGSGVSPESALASAAVPSATSNAATARRVAGTRDEAAGGTLRGLVRARSDAPILVLRLSRGNEEAWKSGLTRPSRCGMTQRRAQLLALRLRLGRL